MTMGLLKLFRLPLAVMNGVAAVGGYLLFPAPADLKSAAAVLLGVSLLAAAASALNQVLERDLDALMSRTGNRPLPRGDLAPATAVAIGVALLLVGASVLAFSGGVAPVVLGSGTVAWYLGVYTPLKRRTPFALLLGALCGSAAPFIGWSVAGGALYDFRVVLLAGVIYLWQVPHFWLLRRRFTDDYRLAGFPVFEPPGEGCGLAPVCRLWIGAMLAGTLMLPAFGIVDLNPLLCFIAFFTAILLTSFRRFEPAVFAALNLFPLVVTIALCLG
ncbi:MAG TPA: protoheme IX farnesyltransferase [Geobacter sp.]|nr:protoheme IX farnesyltransferase [Geobacter sp.]